MEESVVQIFENDIFRVRTRIDKNGSIFLNVADIGRGLGFTQNKNGIEYVRYETINSYVKEIKEKSLSQIVGKVTLPLGKDDYIPENLFYRLAMKANNAAAEKFQAWIADEVLPALHKYGYYISPNAAVRSSAVNPYDKEAVQILLRCAELTTTGKLRDKLIRKAASLLTGEKF